MFQPNNKQQKEVKFFLYKNDYHSGPFVLERIREMLIENVVGENDIICEEGKEEWITISQVIKSSVSSTETSLQNLLRFSIRRSIWGL